ncbi:MAG: Gfo/Idh/MocA family oxidoreductase [Trueperaceae bacterium]|nr:Gfo/Idh/MocA family oxidoreductase [Trueperaceae bacterium]
MGKEIKSRAMALNPHFAYVPEGDRYILTKGEPHYKFNVIGTGVNGQEHIRVTELEGRASVYGVYDPNRGSVAAAQHEYARFATGRSLHVYNSLEAACSDPEVDGLIICTPNYTHLEVVKVAIESGKHILLEKPIATTVKDAHMILRLAKDYPAVFQIGLQYRYKAIYQEAIYEALNRKSLGDIKTLSMLEHRLPFLDKVGQWNKFARFSGNTLVEKCCHYFDLLNLFAGSRPKTVFATGSQAVNFKDFEYEGERSDILDNAMVIIVYENGVQASFNLCMFAPMLYEELIICGDDGRLKAWEKEDFLPESSSGTHLEILHGDNKPSRRMTPHYPAIIEQTGHHGATYYEHVQFINQIENIDSNAATPLEGLWSIVVAAAAQESIKSARVISINEFLQSQGLEL